MLIDAHQHYWRIGRNGHEWPTPELAHIHRDFEPADWESVAVPIGVTASVAVQSQPGERDTDWLLRLADETPSIKAVVGWTELKAADGPHNVHRLAGHPKLKGLRPMLQDLAEDDWIDDPALDPAICAMIDTELCFDALVFTRHLPHLRAFAERWPDLPIVIDHGAKPPIANGQVEPWREQMARLAELPNVMCKLSGLFTEMATGQSREALAPYVRHLAELFGPERLMWGSDWPVILIAGEYDEWFRLAGELTGFDERGRAALFGGTAARFYGIRQ
ncbi:MAG: amidohydrolase family protein [Sphingomicrobium sp.]